MTLTVITPTCNRPAGFALLEHYMARQTRQPDQWLVADGGSTAVVKQGAVTFEHLWVPTPPGAVNLCTNLLRSLAYVRSDLVAIMEDDDYYAPDHLAKLTAQLSPEYVMVAGDPKQRYYNVQHKMWRVFDNKGSSLCQTGFKAAILLPLFTKCVQRCLDMQEYGVDGAFWQKIPKGGWALDHTATVVGVKGLPGQTGLGVGHRPEVRRGWRHDPDLQQLRAWIGDDDLTRYLAL
jgi:glycosyltransferase involved in cell wall biosynthesis